MTKTGNKRQKRGIWGVGGALVGVVLVALGFVFAPTLTALIFRSETDGCGVRPQNAYYAADQKLELALRKTVAVFKGESSVKVLDAFPPEARNVHMVGYMACKAGEQGLLKDADDLIRYTESLKGFFQKGDFTSSIRHFGPLKALAKFVRKDPGLSLTLHVMPEVQNVYIDETLGADFRGLMRKNCDAQACLACRETEHDGTLTAVTVSLTTGDVLVERSVDGAMYKACKG